jgi:hypothetical protein
VWRTQTIFTIGYGDMVMPVQNREFCLAVAWILATVFLNALIVANLTSIIANQDIINVRFRQATDSMNQYMEMRALPEALRGRIKAFQAYTYLKTCGIMENVRLYMTDENNPAGPWSDLAVLQAIMRELPREVQDLILDEAATVRPCHASSHSPQMLYLMPLLHFCSNWRGSRSSAASTGVRPLPSRWRAGWWCAPMGPAPSSLTRCGGQGRS